MVDWNQFSQGTSSFMQSIPALMDMMGAGGNGSTSFMARLGHAGAEEAVKSGLTWNEYKKLMQDAAYARQQQDRLAVKQSEQNLLKGALDMENQQIQNSTDKSKFMAMSGGHEPGEMTSNYKGRPLGEDAPAIPNVGVGETSAEQYAGAFQLAELIRKNELEGVQSQLEERRVQVSEKNYEQSKIEEARLQASADAQKEWFEWKKAHPTETRDAGKTMTRDQAMNRAQKIIESDIDSFDLSPSQKLEKITAMADVIQGKTDGETEEDTAVGPGSITDYSGGFEDETNNEQSAREWGVKHGVANQKKELTTKLQMVGSELDRINESQVQAMSVEERALNPKIPLWQVIGMNAGAPTDALKADMAKYDRQAREYLANGVPPEQWDDATYFFMQKMVEEFEKQQNGGQ